MTRRGGWCPECEAEGADPSHNRRTILCGKHHSRKYRQTPEGAAAVKRANDRYYNTENGKAKRREYWARYYASEHGRQVVRARDERRIQTPLVRATYNWQPLGSSPSQKEDEQT